MQYLEWTPEQSRSVLAALAAVVSENGAAPPTRVDRTLLGCLAEHVLRIDVDLDRLPAVTPAMLAAVLPDAEHRVRAVTFLTIGVYAATEVVPGRADVAQAFADGLAVASDATRYLQRLRAGQMWRLKLDYTRALLQAGIVPGDTLVERLRSAVHALREQRGDAPTAERFAGLAGLPDGTLGKAFFQFYRRRGYPLPGEPGCIPEEVIAVHDLSHILTGFNTDRAGEIAVVTCQAGYMKKHPYEMILDGLTSFHMGIMLDAQLDIPPAKGFLDPHLMMLGFERGTRMSVDLMDHWDYWAVMPEPVASLRKRYGIIGAADVWLDPPPPETGDKRLA
jgi:ubiquinone biosynthesis protein Coq4